MHTERRRVTRRARLSLSPRSLGVTASDDPFHTENDTRDIYHCSAWNSSDTFTFLHLQNSVRRTSFGPFHVTHVRR